MNPQTKERIKCGCGCGDTRPRYDSKGRERRFIVGHQNRIGSPRQKAHREWLVKTFSIGGEPWNKGKTYLIGKRSEYAHKGSWKAALKRLHGDLCARCGWDEAPCDSHHIVAKRNGGKFTLENGIILCPNCHRLAEVGKISERELNALKKSAPIKAEAV